MDVKNIKIAAIRIEMGYVTFKSINIKETGNCKYYKSQEEQ